MPVKYFAIDHESALQVVEELVDGLDVCGFPKPLEAFQNDESQLFSWARTLEDREPAEVLKEWAAEMLALQTKLQAWNKEDPSTNLKQALQCLAMALNEMKECCSTEEE